MSSLHMTIQSPLTGLSFIALLHIEMDRQTKCQENGDDTEMDEMLSDFFLQVLECVITFDLF